MNKTKRVKGVVIDIKRRSKQKSVIDKSNGDLIFATAAYMLGSEVHQIFFHCKECSKNLQRRIRINTVITFKIGNYEGRNEPVGTNVKFVDQIQTAAVKDALLEKADAQLRVLRDCDLVPALLAEGQFVIDDLLEDPTSAGYATNVLGTTVEDNLVILLDPGTTDIFSGEPVIDSAVSDADNYVEAATEADTRETNDEIYDYENVPATETIKGLKDVNLSDSSSNTISK